jgi:hypothetical protein
MAAGACVAVAGKLDEVDLVRDPDRPREVGEEDEARFQQRDEQEFAVGVVGCDLLAELADARAQLLRAEEDLADSGVVAFYEARLNRYRCASRSMSRL